jgi:DNA-binding phage protein
MIAKLLKLSQQAKIKLDWIIYYETKAKKNASLVARHFGISRKTFYKKIQPNLRRRVPSIRQLYTTHNSLIKEKLMILDNFFTR